MEDFLKASRRAEEPRGTERERERERERALASYVEVR
jgi:hypothetical protein